MSKPTVVDILAVIYLAGIENGLGRQLTNYDEIRHRKEAFINGNPALQEALAQLQSLIERSKLKLLAEVRGRVVGDNEDTQKWEDPIDRQVADECNQLRAEMRTILTKLEAEL